jgi:membrane-bound serine protease (ClpP class)
MELKLEGTVSPGVLDYLERGFSRAKELSCTSILLHINTPGGSLQTTRVIVERILASPVPVLCLVSPAGGHAGSAGAIILMACHVAGAEPATNIGAATPISLGEALPEDLRNKLVQDTVSWVKGLALLRGRNVDYAEKVVTEAKALESGEAAKIGAIDTVAGDTNAFLDFAEGREVTMNGGAKVRVMTGALTAYEPDLRHDLLQLLTDPQFAYLLFMVSLGLLYFELTHPGFGLPGVAGGIGLILSLIAFQKLEVRWGGVLLIALGIGLLIAEAFLPTFGVIGVGGLIALAIGSIFLYDPATTGFTLPLSLIAVTVGSLGLILLSLATLAFRTWRRGRAKLETVLIGKIGEVASLESPSLRRGMVSVEGEFWRFACEKDVRVRDRVEVVAQEGFVLRVRPVPETPSLSKTQ